MTQKLSIRCPSCRVRLKAPAQLIGQMRSCPGCGEAFVVPGLNSDTTEEWQNDSAPILVAEDDTTPLHMPEETAETSASPEHLRALQAENARLKRLVAELSGAIS